MTDASIPTRLFLIDDDTDEHELFIVALRQIESSIALYTATDGLDAMAKLYSDSFDRPDVILLDLNMPRMNGMQFLENIKKTENYAQIPVHIYSTSSSPIDKQLALDLGATSFFTKPDDLTGLCSILQSLV